MILFIIFIFLKIHLKIILLMYHMLTLLYFTIVKVHHHIRYHSHLDYLQHLQLAN